MQDTSKYNNGIHGYRKLIAMIICIVAIMISGYTMNDTLGTQVLWSIVAVGGAYLTGNIISKRFNQGGPQRPTQHYDEPEADI